MGNPVKKEATYTDLFDLPENMIGEIINGDLHTMPRPSPKHSMVVSSLGGEIVNPFSKGHGGPGGWIILFEPDLFIGKKNSGSGSRRLEEGKTTQSSGNQLD